MEEKKNIKISLGGAIAIAIGVIALLIAILYAIITGISVKQELADKEAKLNTMEDKINKINMAINEVQSKEADKNKNVLEVNVNSLTNTNTMSNNTNTVQNTVSNTTNTMTNTTNTTNTTTNNTVDTSKMEEAYKNIIISKKSTDVNLIPSYATVDINKDGIKELILSIGEIEATRKYEFYTFEDGKAVLLGEIGGGHSGLYEMNGKDYIWVINAHMGSEKISRLSIKDNKISSELESTRTVPTNESYKTGDKEIIFKTVN